MRVLTLESRHAEAMKKLIENEGGVAVSAPSMREVAVKDNPAAAAFAEELLTGRFDAVVFLTGVGTRTLFEAVETVYPRHTLTEALAKVAVVARGPKPASVLREYGVPVTLAVPEPNTWRDILIAMKGNPQLAALAGKRIAVQEYGASNPELLEAPEAGGATVSRVPVYQWALPEDTEPLRRAIAEIAAGKIDVLLATSATQITHLMQVAAESGSEEAVRRGLRMAVVASVGPICSEALQRHGIAVDMEPSHPKMGQLVHDTAARAAEMLRRKRGGE